MLFTVFAVRAADAGADVPARCGEDPTQGPQAPSGMRAHPGLSGVVNTRIRDQDHARASVALGKRGASENEEEWNYEEPGVTTHTNFLGSRLLPSHFPAG